MKTKEFTKQDAIEIQLRHLKQLEPKLIPELYTELCIWATSENDNVTDPYDIRRGESLSGFIENWKPKPIKEIPVSGLTPIQDTLEDAIASGVKELQQYFGYYNLMPRWKLVSPTIVEVGAEHEGIYKTTNIEFKA